MAIVETRKPMAGLEVGKMIRRNDGHLFEVTVTANKAASEGEYLIAKRITKPDNYKKEDDKNAGRYQLFESDIDWDF